MTAESKTYPRIVAAALAGTRCPTNDELPSLGIQRLVRAGLIRVEVFDKNFRQVTLLTGDHAGKATAPPPQRHDGKPQRPYLVSDARGTFRNGWPVENAKAFRNGQPAHVPSVSFKDGRRVR